MIETLRVISGCGLSLLSHMNFCKGPREAALPGMWAAPVPSCSSHSGHILPISLLWASTELASAVILLTAINLIHEMLHGVSLGLSCRPQVHLSCSRLCSLTVEARPSLDSGSNLQPAPDVVSQRLFHSSQRGQS